MALLRAFFRAHRAFSLLGAPATAPMKKGSHMISSVGTSSSPDLFAAPRQGIQRGIEQLNTAAGRIAEGDLSPENVVQEIQAEILVKANTVSARTAGEILGSLIDTLA